MLPESRALLSKNLYRDQEEHSSCEDWSSSCSSYSDTESSIAEWENLVDENGELLYIDCHPHVTQTFKEETSVNKNENSFQRTTATRRSTRAYPTPAQKAAEAARDICDVYGEGVIGESTARKWLINSKTGDFDVNDTLFDFDEKRRRAAGKLVRLIRRRESKRYSKRSFCSYTDAYATSETPSSNKVTFRDCQEGEVREVTLQVDPQSRHKLGRRATLIESLLGITISTFSGDGDRIMVAGFIPDGEAIKHRNIKIGDWLKCVNDTEVTFQTVNGFLETITESQEVRLKLQRIAAIEVTNQPPKNELSNQSEFVRQLTNFNQNEEDVLRDLLCDFSVGVIYLNTEGLTETGPEFEGVMYCYPTPLNRNNLCASRGTFITLNLLLPDILKMSPTVTTVIMNNNLTHIVYNSFENGKLLLIAFPDKRCSSKEALKVNKEIVRTLEFCYQSVDQCFSTARYRQQVDRFFSRVFARLLTSGTWPGAQQHIELKDFDPQKITGAPVQFENVLPASHWIPLPKEAQMQLDDALNELETCDYRDWNEDPLDCQRLFTIIGSSFYHDGYMLASHFQCEDLIDVHCFCREQGILHLSSSEPIRTLVLWREVFPSSCNRGLPDDSTAYKLPEGRWFLLVVGNGKDLLMVLMESGGSTVPSEVIQPPDVFYVEEAQDTLRHIQNMGICSLAARWLSSNLRPQVASLDLDSLRTSKNINFFTGLLKSSPQLPTKPPSPAAKKEVTSILKHRGPAKNSSVNLSGSGSLFSNEDASEDSQSQGASELSDEPVMGRRAARERASLDSDDSDSDWEAYRPHSQVSGNLDEFKHLSDMPPTRLTAGEENVLFNYIHFDQTEGILLCPPTTKPQNYLMEQILSNFRSACQVIHGLLQNTVRFKSMLAEDMAKNVANKSLIAIKEHGILFECSVEENGKKSNAVNYWVIGRLFYTPHPKELYVCYQDTVPQNLVEIAFRLGVHMNG